MTDQLSGGVVQPTDAQIDALRQGPLMDKKSKREFARAVFALAVPQAPLQAEPVPVVASEPVAWRCGQWLFHSHEDAYECQTHDNSFAIEPLYATPQAEPAVAEQAREASSVLEAFLTHWVEDVEPKWKTLAKDMARHDISTNRLTKELESSWRAWQAALASQSTPPPESAGQGLSDAEICEVEHAVEALRQIAGGQTVIGDTVERVADIRRARGIATIAHRRLEAVLAILAANPTAKPDGGSKA